MAVIITTRPADVLDMLARLTTSLLTPGEDCADFHQFFMRSASHDGTDPLRANGMFWPSWDGKGPPSLQHGARFARVLGLSLRDALPYEVTRDMLKVMRATYEKSTARVMRLDQEEMPCPSGVAWLDDGWTLVAIDGSNVTVRVVSWDFQMVATSWTTDAGVVTTRGQHPCARLSLWNHTADVTNDQLVAGGWDPEDAAEADRRLGTPLRVFHTALIPFGKEFTYPDDRGPHAVDAFLHLVHLLWMFLGMEITATQRHQVRPESKRKRRALRSLKHNEVHVVLLRRVRHATDEEGTSRDIDWSCRWVVQGHWRHRAEPGNKHRGVKGDTADDGTALCALCGDRLYWVEPYIKGPDGRPLKVSRTLYRLAR